MTGITDIGADAAQSSQGNGTNGDYESDYERFDLTGANFGMQHPTTAVRGEAVALRKLYDEDDPDRADVATMLENASIVTDDAGLDGSVVVTSTDESDQFKVVDLTDEATAILGSGGKEEDIVAVDHDEQTITVETDDGQESYGFDELMGIDFSGNTYYGDVQSTFDLNGPIALKRGGGAGRSISSTLDVDGATAAQSTIERDEDGEIVDMELADDGFPAHNGGYIEYHPDGRDGERPRQSRDPQLRDDVEGREVVVMIQRLAEVDPDYTGNAYWATVFANVDDDRQTELTEQYAEEDGDATADSFVTELGGTAFIRLQPTDTYEPDQALLDETGWISWNGFDRSDPAEVQFLNQERLDADFGNVYVPEGMSVADAVGDAVDPDEVVLDPDDDTPEDAITAFGAGATEDAQAEIEA